MPHDAFYTSKPWRDARAAQLRRNPYCETCLLLGQRVKATQVDHRRAIAQGGHPFDPKNLRSMCMTHHSQKTIMLDGQHQHTGKQIVITGPDGWPISKEGPENYGNAQNNFNPPGGRRR